jgi:uncharacterized protein YecA (UPF0149 family)
MRWNLPTTGVGAMRWAWRCARMSGKRKEALGVPELQEAFLPILAIARTEKPGLDPIENPQTYQAMVDALPQCAVEIAQWWRSKLLASLHATAAPQLLGTIRRAAPKVSPNASCPCGSGKKFKRCCSALRAL